MKILQYPLYVYGHKLWTIKQHQLLFLAQLNICSNGLHNSSTNTARYINISSMYMQSTFHSITYRINVKTWQSLRVIQWALVCFHSNTPAHCALHRGAEWILKYLHLAWCCIRGCFTWPYFTECVVHSAVHMIEPGIPTFFKIKV